MRLSLRALSTDRASLHTRVTATVIALITALVAVLATFGFSTAAEAQAPLPVGKVVTPTAARPAQNPNLLPEFNAAINRGLAAVAQAREAKVQAMRSRVVSLAKAQIGDTYVAGAAGPNRFDCSGLMLYAFAGVGIKLDHYSGSQYNAGRKVPSSQMQRGDLIFYGPNASQHEAMYLGDGMMLEAPYTGSVVKISPVRSSGMTPYVTRLIEY